jgi:WD40 repeat protein
MIERLSPNGMWIASGTGKGGVRVQGVVLNANGWCVREAHQGAVCVLAWSPDGTAVASGGEDGMVKVWKAATGTVMAHYAEHTGPVIALAWSPDGKWIASVEGTGGPHIWQLHCDPSCSPCR